MRILQLMNELPRYPSARPVLLDDDGLPVPCRACASKVRGVAQLATCVIDGDATCDSCAAEWGEHPRDVVSDTVPCPPPDQDDDPRGCEQDLERTLALVEAAKDAGVPPLFAFQVARDAIKRVAGRSR